MGWQRSLYGEGRAVQDPESSSPSLGVPFLEGRGGA